MDYAFVGQLSGKKLVKVRISLVTNNNKSNLLNNDYYVSDDNSNLYDQDLPDLEKPKETEPNKLLLAILLVVLPVICGVVITAIFLMKHFYNRNNEYSKISLNDEDDGVLEVTISSKSNSNSSIGKIGKLFSGSKSASSSGSSITSESEKLIDRKNYDDKE